MMPLRALIVGLSLAILLTGSHMWLKHTTQGPITPFAPPHVHTTSVLDEVATGTLKMEDVRDDDRAEPRVDLNGNQIDDAVGDYRVDLLGELYERHAPDTAIPHLGEPRL